MHPVLPLISRISRGELTPRAAFERFDEAVSAREASLQAFAHLEPDRARLLLDTDGERLARLPLGGLPAGIKDIFDTAGMPTTYGSPIYAGHQPLADAASVVAVRHAGGVLYGKTVSTEFAFLHPGPTRNPHDEAHTPGGSSSGSAAAVAAGMVAMATGTQTAGSVIRPASFCGIAGYKPSFAMIPPVGAKTFSWSLDTVGLLAPTVPDVAHFAAAVTGLPLAVSDEADARPRLALALTAQAEEAGADAHRVLERAATLARQAGAGVVSVHLPASVAAAFEAQQTVMSYEGAAALAFEHETARDRMSTVLREYLDAGAAIPATDYVAALQTADSARTAFEAFMQRHDALLTFSSPGAAPEGLASTGAGTFNRLWTMLGVPAVNVAGLTDPAGMPIGVQVVGRFRDDARTLAVATWLERQLAGAS